MRERTYLLVTLLLGITFFSCTKSDPDTSTDPANLSVTVATDSNDVYKITVTAHADNTIEYRLHIDESATAALTNTSGTFEYGFTEQGDHKVEVRAYGTSGKYIKEIRTVTIGSNEVPLENGYFTPMTYAGMQLVWNDEFDASTINADYWSFETGAGGWGNNELQYYKKENAWTEGGTLIIEARKENAQSSVYTSARMVTRNKKTFQYGRVDIRALLPEGQGIWPALWMLGNNISSVGWPKCGEIDIMEMIGGNGRENTVYSTLHWDDNGHVQAGGSLKLPTGTFSNKYHVFSMIWDATTMKFMVDDQQSYIINITPAHMSEFHQQCFFIFNIAVGGNWPGYPNSTTRFPQQMKVDYIRVFQN